MKYGFLGKTGQKVSKITFGKATFSCYQNFFKGNWFNSDHKDHV